MYVAGLLRRRRPNLILHMTKIFLMLCFLRRRGSGLSLEKIYAELDHDSEECVSRQHDVGWMIPQFMRYTSMSLTTRRHCDKSTLAVTSTYENRISRCLSRPCGLLSSAASSRIFVLLNIAGPFWRTTRVYAWVPSSFPPASVHFGHPWLKPSSQRRTFLMPSPLADKCSL